MIAIITSLSFSVCTTSANTYICNINTCDSEEMVEIPDGTILFENEYVIYFDRNGNIYTEEQIEAG